MPQPLAPTVAAYIKALPLAQGQMLAALVNGIKADFPQLELRLAWNVPHFCLGKAYVVGISAAKNHLSFSPWSKQVIAAHQKSLLGLATTENLIRIPLGWELNRSLIYSLVKARLQELKSK